MCHPQVTAAGDQMAKLWDVKSGDLLGSFKGHLCSLKSVAFAPQEKGIAYIWRNIRKILFASEKSKAYTAIVFAYIIQ